MCADLEKTVSIVFKGKDDLSKKLKSISGSLDTFGRGVTTLTDPLAGMARTVEKLELVFAGLAAGGIAYAFTKSKEFESASIDLQKVIGDQIEFLDEAKVAALGLSSQYGESSVEILQSTANFKQAGFDVQEAMTLTKNALDLVIAGDLEAAESSDILVRALKGFKAPASEAGRLMDIMNAVSEHYASNIRELATGMADLSPIANLMGFSMEQTAAILTPVIEIFGSGSEAARAFKTGLLRLIADQPKVQAALKALGVSQTDVNGKLRSGKDIMFDVAKAFQTAEKDQKLFLTTQLVGIQQAGKMVEAFDGLDKVLGVVEIGMNSAGSITKEVALRLASAEVAVNRFKVGWENLAIVVGDQFRAAATEAIEGGVAIELALQKAVSDGSFEPIFEALRGFSTKLGVFLQGVAEAMPEALGQVDFTGLVDSVEDLGTALKGAFEALFGEIDLTTPEGLAAAIQKIVDGAELLTNVTSGIVEAWTPFLEMLGKAFESATSLDEATEKLIGKVLGMGQALNIVAKALPGISGGMNTLAGAIGFLGTTNLIRAGASGGLLTLATGLGAMKLALAGGAIGLGLYGIAKAAEYAAEKADELLYGPLELLKQPIETHLTLDSGNVLELATGIIRDIEGRVISIPFEIKEPTGATRELIDWSKDPEIKKLIVIDGDKIETTAESITDRIKDAIATGATFTDEIFAGVADSVNKKLSEIDPISKDQKTLAIQRLEEIKVKGKTIQTAVEWSAKLNISKVESETKRIEALFKSLGTTIESTTDLLGDLFGSLGSGDLHGLDLMALREAIDQNLNIQQEAWELQKKTGEAGLRLLELKAERMERGDAMIQIDGAGLQPHLEAFMYAILEELQITMSEEASEFLLNVPA